MATFDKHTFDRLLLILITVIILTGQSISSAQTTDLEKARQLFNKGQYSECIESSKKAIINRSYSVEWPILLIESLMELGRYKEAASEVDMALLRHRLSIRLFKLGYQANLHNGRKREADDI